MLDPRLYRAAFAPLLLALVVAAFSLVDRPRPIETPLAPDAFDGARAMATLQGLAGAYPDRRPGSLGDQRLAGAVEKQLRGAFCPGRAADRACPAVSVRSISGQTIDGERDLETVIAQRLGKPGPGIVVVAHRDAAGPGAEAELSGTAALLELARVFAGRRTQRTLTLVSTSGASGGLAGAYDLAEHPTAGDPRPDAVLVLGDLASARPRKPWVLPFSTSDALAPVRLRRTADAALKQETGQEPGTPRAAVQLARLAFPLAMGEEGPFNGNGIPAVLISATGERGPAPGAAVSAERLKAFGRAALRTIDALDNGPTLRSPPGSQVLIAGKVMPAWVVRLIVGLLLLPPFVAAVDGVARVRRRRLPIAPWLRWLCALALPFVAALLVARLLGITGLLPAVPGAAVPSGRVSTNGVALGVVICVFLLAVLIVRPLGRMVTAAAGPPLAGAAAAVAATLVGATLVAWLVNPFAAALLVIPAHMWMLAATPEVRVPRPAALAMVLAGLVPAAVVLWLFADATGAGLTGLPWSLLLLVAGGQVGWLALLAICVAGACAAGAARVAAAPGEDEALAEARPSIRGPMGYVGPGSLGGTESGYGSRR